MGLRPLACWDCKFESSREHGCLSFVCDLCCQVEVSVLGLSLVQMSLTDCGVSEYDHGSLIMRRLWSTGLLRHGKKILGVMSQWYVL